MMSDFEFRRMMKYSRELRKKNLIGQKDWKEIRENYLQDSDISDLEIVIKKNLPSYITGERKNHYSLWIELKDTFLDESSPVVRYQVNTGEYLFSTRKDSPLKIKIFPLTINRYKRKYSLEEIELSKELLGLHERDFMSLRGYILAQHQREIAEEIFRKVQEGIEILPRQYTKKGYSEKRGIREKCQNKTPILKRVEGVKFLESLNPDEIIQGNLLASGSAYVAYRFEDKIVVESDESQRATYIFTEEEFDNLRHRNRQTILETRPNGFVERMIHRSNNKRWERKILELIKE